MSNFFLYIELFVLQLFLLASRLYRSTPSYPPPTLCSPPRTSKMTSTNWSSLDMYWNTTLPHKGAGRPPLSTLITLTITVSAHGLAAMFFGRTESPDLAKLYRKTGSFVGSKCLLVNGSMKDKNSLWEGVWDWRSITRAYCGLQFSFIQI